MHILNISAKTIHLECADLLVIPECRQPRKPALITAAATTKANGSTSTAGACVRVRERERESNVNNKDTHKTAKMGIDKRRTHGVTVLQQLN